MVINKTADVTNETNEMISERDPPIHKGLVSS